MKKKLFIIVGVCVFIQISWADQTQHQITKHLVKPVKFCKSEPLINTIAQYNSDGMDNHEFHILNEQKEFNYYYSNQTDPSVQRLMGNNRQPPLINNFEGVPCINQVSNPDTEGDVGPNHYFQMVKRSFAIWDKEGNLLYGPAENKTIWNHLIGPWNDMMYTDPIVLYDHISDRWLASCMVYDLPDSFYEVIAISETPDPLGSWYCYAYEFANMPDYPKFGVWPDGYYMTINEFYITPNMQGVWEGLSVMVFNRDDMINGNPEPETILFDFEPSGNDIYTDPSCFLPADIDGSLPPFQTPNYLACVKDDAWGFDEDHIWIWECSIDWADTSNCYLSEVSIIPTNPFESNSSVFEYIPQPNNANLLAALSDRLLHRLQYRKFDDYEAIIATQAVKIDESEHTGMRWYELRNEGNGWYIYQQGTYTPDDEYRWMGSIAMDKNGNIALGYSVSSISTYPSIRFTGRRKNDPLGLMTIEEQEIIAGSGSQINNPRWGDYSSMSVDPIDDLTFWYTQEYIPIFGTFTWQTRIASFIINIDLTVLPDTLIFNTPEECFIGKEFSLKNDSYEDITILDIEQEGLLGDAYWYIEPWTITLPYAVESGDSMNLNVKVDLPVNLLSDDYVVDTLTVTTAENTYNVTIKLDESLICSVDENYNPMYIFDCLFYPNPFNPTTTISFSIPNDSNVELSIYNIKGQKVKQLVSDQLPSGQHSVMWDSRDDNNLPVGSGIYFYQLRIDGNSKAINKMILIK